MYLGDAPHPGPALNVLQPIYITRNWRGADRLPWGEGGGLALLVHVCMYLWSKQAAVAAVTLQAKVHSANDGPCRRLPSTALMKRGALSRRPTTCALSVAAQSRERA